MSWLIQVDEDGFGPCERVAAAVADRYGVDAATILAELRAGMIDRLVLDPAVRAALEDATAAGHVPVMVTNGTTAQPTAKIRHTGLDRQRPNLAGRPRISPDRARPRLCRRTPRRHRCHRCHRRLSERSRPVGRSTVVNPDLRV